MIVTFGEIMLRLSPAGYQRLKQSRQLDMTFGGGEANVAVSLAQFGANARFVTKLPQNDIGEACKGELRRYGVDVSAIVKAPAAWAFIFAKRGLPSAPAR